MSAVDDTRKLLQDIIAPDLKEIGARLDALEKKVDQRFEAVEKNVNHRFEAADKNVNQRFDAYERIATLRHELLLAKMDSLVSVINAH